MALALYDRVRETTTVLGTNDATLLGAVTGFQSFAAVGNGNTCYYTIADQLGNWEVGLGTYSTTGPTLARTTVYASSNSGSKVAFPSGTKDVFLTYPAERAVQLDASGNLSNVAITGVSINSTPIGASSASTGVFTQVNITGQGDLRLEDTTGGEYVALQAPTSLSASYTLTMPVDDGAAGDALVTDGSGNLSWSSAASGDVYGPASSTDNALARFDGTTGKLIQNSVAILSDAGEMSGLTGLSSTSITDSGLTSGRVTYAGTGGLLQDSANLTFNGTTLSANAITSPSITDSGITSGQVVYAGTGGLLSGSINFTWSGSTLGITGALSASADSSFTSTGALLISKGTTAEQPGTPVTGMMRYNSTTNQFEGYSGSIPAWKSIGGSALSNDTSTATNLYPVFASATTGTAENLYTSNANYLYKPSTGELQSLELVATNGIFVNSQTVSANYSIPSGSNAMSAGPVAVASGVTVTVPSGSVWTVV